MVGSHARRVAFLVRLHLCLSYSPWCDPFTLCCAGGVLLVFRSFSEGTVPYVARDLLCPWEEASLGSSPPHLEPDWSFLLLIIILFLKKNYLFTRHTHREAETQTEGEAGSMQGARRGTRSLVSSIRPWAEGGTKSLSHLGCPIIILLMPIMHMLS